MKRVLNRDLIIGIGIGLVLASFFLFFFSPPPVAVEKVGKAEPIKAIQQPVSPALVVPKKEPLQQKPDEIPIKKAITIPVGSGSEEIAAILVEQKVIVSASAFLQAARESGAEYRLRAGTFMLTEQMNDMATVLQILLSEPQNE